MLRAQERTASAAAPIEERLVDALGPIVVKEVRQGLRARLFGVTFGLLLAACLVAAVAGLAEARGTWGDEALGQRYLALFLGALGILEFFVIPFTAFRSTVREREDETWVLLALTGLGGRRIVRGKVASALSQGLLYASACAPFVLFSYYLNGVSIPTLVAALALTAAWAVFLVALGVALGTQGNTPRGRTAAHFVAISSLGLACFAGVAFAALLADEGERLLREDGFVAFLAGVFAFALFGAWLLVEGAAASLALPTEAASRRPRQVLAVQVLLTCVVGGAALVWLDAGKEAAALCSVGVSLVLVFAGTFAISERDGAPRAYLERRGWLQPGALRSYALVMVLLLVSTAVWAAVYPSLRGTDSASRRLHVLLAAPGYVALYLSLAAVVARGTPLAVLGESLASRLAMVALCLVAMVLSPVAAVVTGNRVDDREWNTLNPFFGLLNFAERHHFGDGRIHLLVLGSFAALAVVAAWVFLKSRDGVRRA